MENMFGLLLLFLMLHDLLLLLFCIPKVPVHISWTYLATWLVGANSVIRMIVYAKRYHYSVWIGTIAGPDENCSVFVWWLDSFSIFLHQISERASALISDDIYDITCFKTSFLVAINLASYSALNRNLKCRPVKDLCADVSDR